MLTADQSDAAEKDVSNPDGDEPEDSGNGGDDGADDDDDDDDDFTPHELTSAWASFKNEATLVVWLGDGEIHRSVADRVQEELSALQSLPSKPDRLWVWLTSSGGDLDAAYQIARALQRSAKKVIAVVPRWAKSAATMIALGCHEIVMHPMAELGPLDVQVPVCRHHTKRHASALDAHQSVDFLRMFVADSFIKMTQACVKALRVDESTAGQMAAAALRPMIEPIFSQVDPGEMGEHNRSLGIALEYGQRLMKITYGSNERKKDRKSVV